MSSWFLLSELSCLNVLILKDWILQTIFRFYSYKWLLWHLKLDTVVICYILLFAVDFSTKYNVIIWFGNTRPAFEPLFELRIKKYLIWNVKFWLKQKITANGVFSLLLFWKLVSLWKTIVLFYELNKCFGFFAYYAAQLVS